MQSGAPVCVLGFDVAHALFTEGLALDKTVSIHNHPFRVLGVIAPTAGVIPAELTSVIYQPLAAEAQLALRPEPALRPPRSLPS